MNVVLTILFIALAAMFSAVMSSVDNRPHYLNSIFAKWPASFWSKEDSWQAKRIPGTKYPFNAWHLAQSCMYACFLLAAKAYRPVVHSWLWDTVIVLIGGGVLIVGIFNLFYNKLFKRK